LAKIQSQIIEVCVFRVVDGKAQYLLLQRSPAEKLYPNIWQIVTGTISQDESALDAALREMDEETGLLIRRMWTLPIVDSYFDLSEDTIQIVPAFAVEVDTDMEIRLSQEHQAYEWMNYHNACERIVWPGQKNVINVVNEYIVAKKLAADLLVVKQ
jgi:dihydroneopterin triphosphate diphosphatase